jgi:hypothetical protein
MPTLLYRSCLGAALLVSGSFASALPLLAVGPTYPATGTSVGADWSSDFGVDYLALPDGTVIGEGSVGPSPWYGSDPWRLVEPEQTYRAEVHRDPFLGGGVSGAIEARIGSYGNTEDVVHSYDFDFDLANPSYAGVGTGGTIDLLYLFDYTGYNSSNPVMQYWAAEWSVDLTNPGTSYLLDFSAQFLGVDLLPGSRPDSGHYSGVMSGGGLIPWDDAFCHCDRAYGRFFGGSGIFGAGMYGLATLDMHVDIAFSDAPITEIPRAALPEPATLALLVPAIAAIGLRRRRR